jgi:hypothetical protein
MRLSKNVIHFGHFAKIAPRPDGDFVPGERFEAGGDDHDAGHRDACGREPSLPPLVAVGCDVADQLNLSSRRDSA